MSGRRGNNRIRGPQSALTDFLAANNISAAQIRDDYDRRVRQAEQAAQANGEGPSNAAQPDEEEEDAAIAAAAEEAIQKSKKRKRSEKAAIDKIKDAKKQKKMKKQDSDSDEEYDDAFDVYKKPKPMPGQFEHCELCSKRFTVTPYSKDGPEGGLLCTPCGKQMTKDLKAEEKAKQKKPVGRKRRQAESNKLDGVAPNKVKTLVQLCIEKAVECHEYMDELGDLPEDLMNRLSTIFSKKRVMNSKTVKLFMRPGVETMAIHDAAYLEQDDYLQMFAIAPGISKLVLRNACQLKDTAIEYMLDKCDSITHLQLYAANLVSNEMWLKLFRRYGPQLQTVQLNWLDATFDDEVALEMIKSCPNISRLKLKLCRRLGQGAVDFVSELQHLEHLSLQTTAIITPESLQALVQSRGPQLKTLSLEHFQDLDDSVLAAIHDNCKTLTKLRISENDTATDAAYAALFHDWANHPLKFADFNSDRDVDHNNPNGQEEAVGLADAGFTALMKHSGSSIEHLNIASCRHITLGTFNEVFDGKKVYPALKSIDISFCSRVDTRVIAGIFMSCPAVKKVIAFGCFDVQDVVVPSDVVLIGVPRAQDAIEQFGIGMGLEAGQLVGVTA